MGLKKLSTFLEIPIDNPNITPTIAAKNVATAMRIKLTSNALKKIPLTNNSHNAFAVANGEGKKIGRMYPVAVTMYQTKRTSPTLRKLNGKSFVCSWPLFSIKQIIFVRYRAFLPKHLLLLLEVQKQQHFYFAYLPKSLSAFQ